MTGLSHFYFYICFFSVCVCVWLCGNVHTMVPLVEVRRQLAQIDCLLQLYGFWGWNWGQQASVARTFTCSAISVTTVLISFKWKMGMERFFHARRNWGSCCWVFSIKKSNVKLCVCVWPCILSSTFSRWWVWEALGTSLPMEVTVLEFTSACCSGFRLRLSQSCSVRYHGTTSNDTKSWNKSIDSQSFNLIWNKEGWYQWCWGQEDRAWNIHISVCY